MRRDALFLFEWSLEVLFELVGKEGERDRDDGPFDGTRYAS